MQKIKRVLSKLLFPHVAVVLALVPVAAAFVIYTLAFGEQDTPAAYASYFLSAYALVIACTKGPGIVRSARRFMQENRCVQIYRSDAALRVKVSLYRSLAINVLYALLQLGSGFYHRSIWFYSLCGYYVLLALMRFLLLRDGQRAAKKRDRWMELLIYRFCGVILLLVNLAMGVIMTYIVIQNRGFERSEIMCIAMAAYTFFAMAKAVVDMVRYRKYESPVLSAAKAVNLVAALMSLMSLETAMLTAFGSGDDPVFRKIMTGATGAGVCLAVLGIASHMIITSTKEIRRIKEGEATR